VYASVVAGCAKEAAAQSTLAPAAERYRRLQTAALKSRRLDYSERDVNVTSLGLRAHLIEAGSGEPLLLVHGGNGVGAHWIPLMERLVGWRTIVPDRPGCGLTDRFLYDGVDMRAHGAAFLRASLTRFGSRQRRLSETRWEVTSHFASLSLIQTGSASLC
jgi:pimeloyl-ACP methyl ester carboxylesterase